MVKSLSRGPYYKNLADARFLDSSLSFYLRTGQHDRQHQKRQYLLALTHLGAPLSVSRLAHKLIVLRTIQDIPLAVGNDAPALVHEFFQNQDRVPR